MFQVSYDREWHFFEYLFVLVIGLFGVSDDTYAQVTKMSKLL